MALGAVAKVLHTSIDYLSGITDDPAPRWLKRKETDVVTISACHRLVKTIQKAIHG